QSGLGVTGLWMGGDRTDLHETETERGQALRALRVLVETRCQAQRAGKLLAQCAYGQFRLTWAQSASHEGGHPGHRGDPTQRGKAQPVNLLRVQMAQGRPEENLVEHAHPFPSPSRSARKRSSSAPSSSAAGKDDSSVRGSSFRPAEASLSRDNMMASDGRSRLATTRWISSEAATWSAMSTSALSAGSSRSPADSASPVAPDTFSTAARA